MRQGIKNVSGENFPPPHVFKLRQDLIDALTSSFPFVDPEKIKDLDAGQIIRAIVEIFEAPSNFLDFQKLIFSKYGKNINDGEIYEDVLANAYASYLYNKIPHSQRERLPLLQQDEYLDHLYKMLDGKVNRDEKGKKIIDLFENILGKKKEMGLDPLIGFHVSDQQINSDYINNPSREGQVNTTSASNSEIMSGARFLNFDLGNLYKKPSGSQQFLYLVYSNKLDKGKIYDRSTTAAFSYAPLERYFAGDFAIDPIPLDNDTMKDLNASF